MSLIFTPKIADHFTSSIKPVTAKPKNVQPKVKRERRNSPVRNWTEEQRTKLTALRVLGVSASKCSELLGRTIDSCNKAVENYGLADEIKEKRAVLIKSAMSLD